jgi:biotin carboxyl carrier protein
LVAALLSDMAAGGLSRLQLRTCDLTLVVDRGGQQHSAGARAPLPAEPVPMAPLAVPSPGVGVFHHGGTSAGQQVAAGAELGWVDTNGVRTPVAAPITGTVHGVDVSDGQFVEYGQQLLSLDPGSATEAPRA